MTVNYNNDYGIPDSCTVHHIHGSTLEHISREDNPDRVIKLVEKKKDMTSPYVTMGSTQFPHEMYIPVTHIINIIHVPVYSTLMERFIYLLGGVLEYDIKFYHHPYSNHKQEDIGLMEINLDEATATFLHKRECVQYYLGIVKNYANIYLCPENDFVTYLRQRDIDISEIRNYNNIPNSYVSPYPIPAETYYTYRGEVLNINVDNIRIPSSPLITNTGKQWW